MRDGQDAKFAKIFPGNFYEKYVVSCDIAQKLKYAPAVSPSYQYSHRVLCIPPMSLAARADLAMYRTCMSFVCSVEWSFVLDFSGLHDAGGPIPFFDPLPAGWAVVACELIDVTARTGVYVGQSFLRVQTDLVKDAELFVVVPSSEYLTTDKTANKFMVQYLSNLVQSTATTFIADAFSALTMFKDLVRHAVDESLLDVLAAENSCSLLCSFPLLQALVAPAVNQVLLPCQSVGVTQVVSVPADMWQFPNSELLHLYSGHLDTGLSVEEETPASADAGSSDDEELFSAEELEMQACAAAEGRYQRLTLKLLKDHALKFIHGVSPAHWSLFHNNTVNTTDQLKKVQHAFIHGSLRYYVLQHTFSAGGTTMLRHVLYNLREKFVCVSVWDFSGLQTLPTLCADLRKLNELTGLQVVVLVDLCGDAEYAGTIKVTLIDALLKLPYVRVMVSEHVGANTTTPLVPIATCAVAPAHPTTLLRPTMDLPLQATELCEVLMQRTESESYTIRETMRKLCGLDGRQLEIVRFSEHIPQYIVPEYFHNDGLLNTRRIMDEAKSYDHNWQRDLVRMSSSDPTALCSRGFWPIEVLELSSALENATAANQLFAQFVTTSDPIINIGFFLLGSSDYAERVKGITSRVISLLKSDDLFVLKTVVFAALFAPGLKFDKSFMSNYTPSPLLLGLVSKATRRDRPGKEYLAINVPGVAYILAENPTIFDASLSGTSVRTLYHFLKNDLLLRLRDDSVDQPARRRASLRPILIRAFTGFAVWHWLTPNVPPNTKPLNSSYLIALLWYNNSSKDAVAEMFCQFAQMVALDNHLLTAKVDKIMCERTRGEPDQALSLLWSSDHAMTVVYFLTGASWLCEELAYTKSDYRDKTRELDKCLVLLNKHLLPRMNSRIIPYRYATIYRRHLESYLQHLRCTNEEGDWARIERWSCSAELFFEQTIKISKRAWVFPLVGFAQYRAALYKLLLFDTQRNATSPSFDALVDTIAQSPTHRNFPTILAAVTLFGMEQTVSMLKEAKIASQYIRKDEGVTRTRMLATETTIILYELHGCKELLPLQDAVVKLMRGDSRLYTDGCTCIHYLYMLSTPLAAIENFEMLDRDVPRWAADLELVVDLSAAAHCTLSNSELLQDARVLYLLRYRLVYLVNKWKEAVEAELAHGLGAHRAAVMLAVYYQLYSSEAVNHPFGEFIPSLSTACSDVSKEVSIKLCVLVPGIVYLIFKLFHLFIAGKQNGWSVEVSAHRKCSLLCGARSNFANAAYGKFRWRPFQYYFESAQAQRTYEPALSLG